MSFLLASKVPIFKKQTNLYSHEARLIQFYGSSLAKLTKPILVRNGWGN